MDNWEEICEEQREMNYIYDEAYKQLTELIMTVDPIELLSFLSAYYYFSLLGKDCMFELAEAEYIAGICISSKHHSSIKIDKNELFRECSDLDEHHFEAIINFFGSSVTREECEETIKYFTDDNFFSEHPIIMDGNKVLMINHQLLLWNLRTCVDEELKKDNKIWNEYDKKHKAKFLEAKSVEIIRSLLPQCVYIHHYIISLQENKQLVS